VLTDRLTQSELVRLIDERVRIALSLAPTKGVALERARCLAVVRQAVNKYRHNTLFVDVLARICIEIDCPRSTLDEVDACDVRPVKDE